MLVAVDFSMGQHGHFLDFLINRYIFCVPMSIDNIFQNTGSAHLINTDQVYLDNKLTRRLHFSYWNKNYPENTTHAVFIKHNPELNIVLMTNILHRCHPDAMKAEQFSEEEIVKYTSKFFNLEGLDDHQRRLKWFDDLEQNNVPVQLRPLVSDVPCLNFGFECFFDLESLIGEMKRTADFLNRRFYFDNSLTNNWNTFMKMNQGYNLYQTANDIFQHIVNDTDKEIANDWKLHAYLNHKLVRYFELYEQPELFHSGTYPTNAREIYQLIKHRVDNFDQLAH